MKKTTDRKLQTITVRLLSKGKGKCLSRKVVNELKTRTVIIPQLDDILAALNEAPCEIRLATSDGKDAIRLYRCLTKNFDEQFIAAQTMGDFRHGIIEKRSVRITHRNMTLTKKEVDKINRLSMDERKHVTPDTVVACPKCGYEFRVGKSLH